MSINKINFLFLEITNFFYLKYFILIIIAFVISGCGGNGPTPSPVSEVYKGVFLDNAVEGVTYGTATQSGITDNKGTFKYQYGEVVTFSIGDIVLGQTIGKEIITPIDLVDGANNEQNSTVSNICQLLQSLDVDCNVDNGITINETIINELEGKFIDFNLSITDFENDLVVQDLFDILNERGVFADGTRTLLPAAQTQDHLRETLNTIDNDGDGVTENEGDCDDTDAGIYPGATEICDDGIDQDCDGSDFSCAQASYDMDDDGDGVTENEGDCDDTDASIYPGAPEIYDDGIDQDCDGRDPISTDSDGDGLTDEEEIKTYGTSPDLADTDGDGFNDYTECIIYFEPDINPYKFNPLVADTPKIVVTLTSPPIIKLHMTDTAGINRSFETTRSSEIAQEMSVSRTNSNTFSLEMSHTLSAEANYPWSFGVSYEASFTMGYETTISTTAGMTRENRKALSQAEAFERTNSLSQTGGSLMCTVKVENKGEIAFKVESIILSAVEPHPYKSGELHPIGNLVFNTPGYAEFPSTTIAPDGKIEGMTFINNELDLQTAKDLLRDSTSLLIKPTIVEFSDETGKAFAFNFTDINSKTAMVFIDFADYLPPESYLVATNADLKNRGVTAGKVFRDYLRIPFEVGTVSWGGEQKTGLLGLRNEDTVRVDEGKKGYWLVVHIRDTGLSQESTWYDLIADDYDFETINLRAGDALNLVYIEDKDGDGIYSREEFWRGSSDNIGSVDSDGDGIEDNVELRKGMNPGNIDTDGDGLNDYVDPRPRVVDRFGVVAGLEHALLLKTDGTIWAWGKNYRGQLGLPPEEASWVVSPRKIGTDTDWIQVATGMYHSGAIKEDGTLYTWGDNESGQCGRETDTPTLPEPALIQDHDWKFLTMGGNTSHAFKKDGSHWAWGSNFQGVLGKPGPTTISIPTLIGEKTDRWINFDAGGGFALGVKSDGSLWAVGGNDSGQLGLGHRNDVDTLTKVDVDPDEKFAQLATGNWFENFGFSLVIDIDGWLYTWGANESGQLGNGTTIEDTYKPVARSTGWRRVAAGGYHSLGIKDDGTLYAWGGNWLGQLGLGGQEYIQYKSIPTLVGSDKDWVQITAGREFSIAVKNDGTVWAFGCMDDEVEMKEGIFGSSEPICITSVIAGKSCP
ncbi:MAG: MopE-related protein [bacterium]